MSLLGDAFLKDLLGTLGAEAVREAGPKIPSRVLRASMSVLLEAREFAYVYIPHWWAFYLHENRGPFKPRRAKWLVWYANPRDDPRLQRNPVRYSEWKPLTQDEFQRDMAIQRERERLGLPTYMFVRRFQPKSRPGSFFFTEGMTGFESRAAGIIGRAFDKFVRKNYIVRKTSKVKIRL